MSPGNGTLTAENPDWMYKARAFVNSIVAEYPAVTIRRSNHGASIAAHVEEGRVGKETKRVTINYHPTTARFTITGVSVLRDKHHPFFNKLVGDPPPEYSDEEEGDSEEGENTPTHQQVTAKPICGTLISGILNTAPVPLEGKVLNEAQDLEDAVDVGTDQDPSDSELEETPKTIEGVLTPPIDRLSAWFAKKQGDALEKQIQNTKASAEVESWKVEHMRHLVRTLCTRHV